MIVLENVTKVLSGRKILSDLSLSIDNGETLVLLGRSGTGKSVTLRHLVGLMQPDAGKVEVLGQEISAQDPSVLTDVRSKVGYLFQDGALLNWLTVEENVSLPLIETLGLPAEEIESRVGRVLREVELDSHGDKFPGEISGGMRKRAWPWPGPWCVTLKSFFTMSPLLASIRFHRASLTNWSINLNPRESPKYW